MTDYYEKKDLKPIKIYRIENETTHHGMWYKEDGSYDPFIKKLTEGKSKNLPMGFEERYFKGGTKWFSGCGSVETMRGWFSDLDAFELFQSGYRLFEIESGHFLDEDIQVLFTREGIIKKREIPLETVFNIGKLNKEMIYLNE